MRLTIDGLMDHPKEANQAQNFDRQTDGQPMRASDRLACGDEAITGAGKHANNDHRDGNRLRQRLERFHVILAFIFGACEPRMGVRKSRVGIRSPASRLPRLEAP